MDSLLMDDRKIQLEKPIDIGSLLEGKMSEFTISQPGEDNDSDSDPIIDLDDEEEEGEYDTSRNITVDSQMDVAFSLQKQDMFLINYGIYKKILTEGEGELVPESSRVALDYSGYVEGRCTSFESTWLGRRPRMQKLGEDMLDGLYHCILSMRAGEVAKFIVPYQMLYGELGCEPYGVPGAADVLYLIRLISFKDVGDSDAITDDYIDEFNTYAKVLQRVEKVRKSAKTNFQDENYEAAIKDYKKCITALKFCHHENEKERQDILDTMYVNICICYNKLDRPMEVLRLRDDMTHCLLGNCKAMFQMARAYHKKGDYDDAMRFLARAQKMEPNNPAITAELKLVNEANVAYKENMREISRKALMSTALKPSATTITERPMYKTMSQFVEGFLQDATKKREALPLNLGESELKLVEEIAKNNNLTMASEKTNADEVHFLVKP